MLDQLVDSAEGGKIVNFMGIMARKAGLLFEGMKWSDLGLRKCSGIDKGLNALFVLRNAGIIFSLSMKELGWVFHCIETDIDDMVEEQYSERIKHAQNCLSRFDEFDTSFTEQLRDEVDYLRRAVLSCSLETLNAKQYLQEARQTLPQRLLQAIVALAITNSVPTFSPPN